MHTKKILLLLTVAVLCVHARVGRRKKVCQKSNPVPCSLPIIDIPCGYTSILEPTYGGFGTCNCQNMFLDELTSFSCGCQYDGYGILNSEVSNYGKVPAIKLPKMVATLDSGIPIPAINLPGLFDLIVDVPGCQCQNMQLNCGCRNMPVPVVEYLSPVEIPSPFLKVPYADPCCIQPKCQPVMLPCGCQNMPCNCDNGIKVAYLPCGCQNGCGCQNVPYCQMPSLPMNGPCGCQTCQLPLSPIELPVLEYGCQSMPPPATCCGGKYLRQVTLQPPFL